jgi:hypothetical protein
MKKKSYSSWGCLLFSCEYIDNLAVKDINLVCYDIFNRKKQALVLFLNNENEYVLRKILVLVWACRRRADCSIIRRME